MAKSYSFGVVLAVICLSVILLLEVDAQSTVDESMTCGSSTSDDVVNWIKMIAVNQQENARDIKDEIREQITDVKKLLEVECESSKQALVSALDSICVPLLIQQKVNGSNFFNRSWAEFKVGFNDSGGNYWLGNELLSQLTTNASYKLKFDLQSRNHSYWYYAEYSMFRVLTEADDYTLQVAGYSGNTGYDAFGYHNGTKFSTYDRENDLDPTRNCAARAGGGFWYKSCYACGVNVASGAWEFNWHQLSGGSDLQSSRMWLQCK